MRKNKTIYYEYDKILNKKQINTPIHEIEKYFNQYPFFKTLSDILPSAIYILDYRSNNYLFVSESCENILGYKNEIFYEKGRSFTSTLIHPEDLKIYSSNLFSEFINFSKNIPREELKYYRFNILMRYKKADKNYIKTLQQFVILESTDDGNPLLVMGVMTDISSHISSNRVSLSISKCKDGITKTPFTSEYQMLASDKISLRENEILSNLIKGYSSKEIADKLFLSVYTVNAHRRNLLKKTTSKNTIELIEFALRHGLY